MEDKKSKNKSNESSSKKDEPIFTFNKKKFKSKFYEITNLIVENVKEFFNFVLKKGKEFDFESKSMRGKDKFSKVLNKIISIFKVIISKAWKIFKVILILILLLLIGVFGGIIYAFNHPDTIDNWIRIGIEIGNSHEQEINFKSFSYEGFGNVYLDKNVTGYRDISDYFKSGEIEYEYFESTPINYIYDMNEVCDNKEFENKFIVNCYGQSFVVNKFFNKVWVFEYETIYDFKDREHYEDYLNNRYRYRYY